MSNFYYDAKEKTLRLDDVASYHLEATVFPMDEEGVQAGEMRVLSDEEDEEAAFVWFNMVLGDESDCYNDDDFEDAFDVHPDMWAAFSLLRGIYAHSLDESDDVIYISSIEVAEELKDTNLASVILASFNDLIESILPRMWVSFSMYIQGPEDEDILTKLPPSKYVWHETNEDAIYYLVSSEPIEE